jgi:putative aminopeptidase FrvX
MDKREELLKALTEAHGVPGYETEIRSLIRGYLAPLGTLEQDKMGSVICRLDGTSDGPRVLIAGHMDEIGFMVRYVTKDGYLKFLQLGGWWDQVLLGHRVVVKTRRGDLTGIIGAKPIHIVPQDERKKVVEKRDMVIDIGASSADEVAEAGVRVGDPIVPDATFQILASGKTYLSKAFDDRVGCALVVEAMQHFSSTLHPNTLYGVATVQEEVGLRGATTSAAVVEPDVAIILESDLAGDVPGIKPEESDVKLGRGPSLLVYDGRMIPNIRLRDLVMDVAEEIGVPLQLSAIEGGGTDGGAIHLHDTGVPTVVIGVAARHIHSHGGIIHRDDYDGALRLLIALIARLDAGTVAGLTG